MKQQDRNGLASTILRRFGLLPVGLYGRTGVIGAILGLVALWMVPDELSLWSKVMVYWNTLALFYLSLTWFVILRLPRGQLREVAIEQDQHREWGLLLVAAGSLYALLAGVVMLPRPEEFDSRGPKLLMILCGIGVATAWFVTHTAHAIHYAHRYFTEGESKALDFPGEEPTSYRDFVYFALSIGTTFGTTDVEVTSSELRHVVFRHGLLSFILNTGVLALTLQAVSEL
jgi:uncharacterized membrane protein